MGDMSDDMSDMSDDMSDMSDDETSSERQHGEADSLSWLLGGQALTPGMTVV